MNTPKTTEQEILLHLIKNGSVSIFDFPYLSGFRTRISNLKAKFVPIESSKLTSTNKYGRTYSFAMHRLMDKQKAIDLYEKLNGQKQEIQFIALAWIG